MRYPLSSLQSAARETLFDQQQIEANANQVLNQAVRGQITDIEEKSTERQETDTPHDKMLIPKWNELNTLTSQQDEPLAIEPFGMNEGLDENKKLSAIA
jgi:hypothetical protein